MQSGIDRSLLEFVVLLDISSINVQVRFLCRLDRASLHLAKLFLATLRRCTQRFSRGSVADGKIETTCIEQAPQRNEED